MTKSRNGGKPHSEPSQGNDLYFNEKVADYIMNFLVENKWLTKSGYYQEILDACCGNGVLGNSFGKIYESLSIVYVDICKHQMPHYINNKFIKKDILKYESYSKYDIIVCNPPWSPVQKAEQIYHHLLTLLKPDGWLYFIINYAFINTNLDRGRKLGRGHTIFLPRYTFSECLKNKNKNNTGLLDPVLMINKQRECDPPFFCDIPHEICSGKYKNNLTLENI